MGYFGVLKKYFNFFFTSALYIQSFAVSLCIGIDAIKRTINEMTTTEAIQQNIHFYKIELNKARKVICSNEIELLHISGAIDFYLKEIKDLKYSLNIAINQIGKL